MTSSAEPTELETLRDRLLEAALPHAVFDGWTEGTLKAAARDVEASELDVYRAFPGGAEELLDHHLVKADRDMVEALLELDLESMRVRDKIAAAIRLRLEAAAPHKEAVRRGFNHLGLPHRGRRALRALYHTIDLIWRAIGDTSTDFNFYSKRALLAGVYLSTMMYWFNDTSEGHERTWEFLDRRIGDVMRIEKAKGRLRKAAENLPNPFGVGHRFGPRLGRRRLFRM